MAAMILVNNPGDWSAVFPPLVHAYWTGCTFADLVFPGFIFIMGVAMPFAFARRRGSGDFAAHLYGRIGRRVALLIALGLVLNAVTAWQGGSSLRFPGVLQRIALAYLIASLVVLHFDVSRWLVAVAALLLGHWALLALVPFYGHSAGTLTPEHNIARFVDTRLFGRHALTIPNDPEGLLGTLGAAATALIGATTGELMRRAASDAMRLRTLVLGGVLAVSIGAAWSRALPLSKPLWTGSFVLVAAGLATLALALTYVIVNVRRLRRWSRPFLWLGVNPLAIYFCSEIVRHLLDAAWIQQGVARTTPKAWLFWEILEPAFPWPAAWASLVSGAGFVAFWLAVGSVLYRYRIRIQV